jgi:hypothetical protein
VSIRADVGLHEIGVETMRREFMRAKSTRERASRIQPRLKLD